MLKGIMNDIELPGALKVVADLAESKGEILLSKMLNNLSEEIVSCSFDNIDEYVRKQPHDAICRPHLTKTITGSLIKRALDIAIDSIELGRIEAELEREALPIYELIEEDEEDLDETIPCPVCKATGSDVSRYPISGCGRCGGSGRIAGDGDLKVPLIEAARTPKPHRRKKWLGI